MALPPLDPQQRKNLIFGTVALLALGYLFYDRVHTPRAEAVSTAEARLAALETSNATARALTGDLGEDAEATLALYRRQLEAVEGLIPSSEELPDLLDAISAQAQQTGVELSLIEPSDVRAEPYYTRRVYDMAVVGRYHDIGDFLTRVASLPRIVTSTDLTLTPRDRRGGEAGAASEPARLEARFSIETYVIPTTPAEGAADEPAAE